MYGGRLLFPKRSLDYALALYDKFLQLTLSRMVKSCGYALASGMKRCVVRRQYCTHSQP